MTIKPLGNISTPARAHFQVAPGCGTGRLWLSAERKLEWHHGLETGREITVDLRNDGLACWPHPESLVPTS